MSSFTLNKVAGAVLLAALIAMLAGFAARQIVAPAHLEKPAIAIDTSALEAPAEGAPAADAGPQPVEPLLAEANVEAGRKLTAACQACHNFDKGGANKVGPHLWDVVGRPKAGIADFAYSGGMKEKGGDWTYEELNHFLLSPKAFVKGTKMNFVGLSKVQDRANVIAYLRTLSDSPKPLPAAAPAPAEAPAPSGNEGIPAPPPNGGQETLQPRNGDPAAGANTPQEQGDLHKPQDPDGMDSGPQQTLQPPQTVTPAPLPEGVPPAAPGTEQVTPGGEAEPQRN